jgi:hypothetical protein
MEHVLRQCLIALRLADVAGPGEQDRMAARGYRRVSDSLKADTEFIQFSPREQLAKTVAAMMANAQRAMAGG